MSFHTLFVWMVMYPVTFIGFFGVILFQCVRFLFHSPVDVWCMIDEEVKKQQAENR